MSEKDKLIEQYVEQYNNLCEALGLVKPQAVLRACVVIDKIVELAKAEATKWYYPSKGEYPLYEELVLCKIKGGSYLVGSFDKDKKEWLFDHENLSYIECWQYIIPPKEEA